MLKYNPKIYSQICYIYILKDPETGEPRYVGSTVTPKNRRQQHSSRQREKSYKSKWINSLLKFNVKPVFEVIDLVHYKKWRQAEKHYIKEYKKIGARLTNYDEGGIGASAANVPKGRLHLLKMELSMYYRQQTKKNIEESKRIAVKMRHLFQKYPDKMPKTWEKIGLELPTMIRES